MNWVQKSPLEGTQAAMLCLDRLALNEVSVDIYCLPLTTSVAEFCTPCVCLTSYHRGGVGSYPCILCLT